MVTRTQYAGPSGTRTNSHSSRTRITLRVRDSICNWASALVLCAVPLHATSAAAEADEFLSAEQARLGASIIADGFALSGVWLGSEYPDPDAEEITTADLDLWVSVRLAVAAQSLSDAGVQLAQALPSNNSMVKRTAQSLIDASVGCKLAAEAIQTGEYGQAAKGIEAMLVGLRGTGTLRPLDSKARIHRVVSELESIARTLRSRGENIDEIASGVAQACKFAIGGGAPLKSVVEEIQGMSATQLAIADIDAKRLEALFALHGHQDALQSLTEIANNPVPHVDYLLAASVHIGLHELSSDLQQVASMLTACVDGDDDETDCPHLCDDHVFQVSALGLGMGGVTNGLLMNPDEIEEICAVADFLIFLNDYAQQAAVKSALKGRARDLFDKLNFQDPPTGVLKPVVDAFKKINPQYFIKIDYQCCKLETCWDWHFCFIPYFTSIERRNLQAVQTSDWILLKAPTSVTGPQLGWIMVDPSQLSKALARATEKALKEFKESKPCDKK